MKAIIAGGRLYVRKPGDYEYLDGLAQLHGITEVVCGGAKGADTMGRDWAHSRNIPIKMFTPAWKDHGRAAGPIRNAQMAKYADMAILFAGGNGTLDMRNKMIARNKRVIEASPAKLRLNDDQ